MGAGSGRSDRRRREPPRLIATGLSPPKANISRERALRSHVEPLLTTLWVFIPEKPKTALRALYEI